VEVVSRKEKYPEKRKIRRKKGSSIDGRDIYPD
jgi:hypothetical protein